MKKHISLFLTKTIYFLFLICTIIALFIVYKNIKGTFAIGFVIGYAIFAILFILYIAIVAILNAQKVKWHYIKGRAYKFIIFFIILVALGYTTNFLFRPEKIDLFKNLSIAFGLSFAMCFTDIIFLNKKEV
ncbi:hypothetical protein [Clostridium frigidicarnis]|uniref:Uncharacterized protein n=1 Tax=Clostridium frigidicarnis TaxID=84698 RepID=A0A1I0XPQ3_9CLOT|nr:hypothetical protein [Clostridium frigidicarnis]SFB02178.1 hypothetical protein SAMN04488528_100913 [Clostridium frigidicarnis]